MFIGISLKRIVFCSSLLLSWHVCLADGPVDESSSIIPPEPEQFSPKEVLEAYTEESKGDIPGKLDIKQADEEIKNELVTQAPPSGQADEAFVPQTPQPGFVPEIGKVQQKLQPKIQAAQKPKKVAVTKRPSLNSSSDSDASENSDDIVPQCRAVKGKFEWNFEKAKLRDIIVQISRLSCKNFILSDSVKPTQEITILSQHPVSIEQAWIGFQAALESNDIALTKTGQFYKLIKRNDGSRSSIPVVSTAAGLPFDEAMVTYVHEIQNLPKDAARTLVKGMVSSRSGTADLAGEGFLVINDSAQNIRRIIQVLNQIDQPGASERIHVVELRHADVQQIQKKLEELFDISRSRTSAAVRAARARAGISTGDEDSINVQKIVPDERTNKLYIIASEKAFVRVKEVIAMLDTPGSSSSQGRIHVYSLKNSDAKKLATTLSSLTKSSGAARNRPPQLSALVGQESADLFQGEVKITADESTNSLVVVANALDYQAFVRVVEKLDKARTQVYIEAVVMEIGLSDTNDVNLGAFGAIAIPGLAGAAGFAMNPGGQGLVQGLMKGIAQGGPAGQAAGLAGFINTIGFMGPSKDLGNGVSVPSFGAVMKILETSSAIDILSTPSMMTLDNEKTEMSVGQKVPIAKGVSSVGLGTGDSGLGVPLQQIGYEDVKLTFAVTPHVNDADEIRMDIDQSVNDIGDDRTVAGQQQPVILTKSAKTSVMAKDQQTVVIGGLISHKNKTSETKVPILGDIPIIGWLFKTSNKSLTRANLMLVLTPYIVRTQADYQKIFLRKQAERQEFNDLYYGVESFKYDPYIDYDKKSGPVQQFVEYMGAQSQKAENGGPGMKGESVIVPMADDLGIESSDMEASENDDLMSSPGDPAMIDNSNFVPLDNLGSGDFEPVE